MNFVESNQMDQQKLKINTTTPTHYIFVLDDSGSMSIYNKWEDLMTAFTKSIQKIRDLPQSE